MSKRPVLCFSISLSNWNEKYDWHSLTIPISFVRNSFIKNLLTTKSSTFKSAFLSGQASRPYSKIGIHLLRSSCSTTSSVTTLPMQPNMALASRWKALCRCSSVCTRRRSVKQSTWRSASLTHGPASRSASSTKPLTSGQHGYAHAWRQKVASSNICSSN